MRLATLKAYRETFFVEGSAPSTATIRHQCKEGTLPGVLQGARWYVDLDELDRQYRLSAKLDDVREALLKSPELEGLV